MKPIYKELEILNLQQILYFERAKLLFKSKKNIIPVVIANHFEPVQRPAHSYNLRRRQNDPSPKFVFHTATGRKSIQNVGENQWNDLPPYLKDIDSLNLFKVNYKKYILES